MRKLAELKNVFRPRYKRLVRGALPRNSCDGLNPVPMEKLYYYSLLYPEKLEQVGEYLHERAVKLLRRGRVGHVALTMDALAQLLRTTAPLQREALVDPFLRTALLCLQSHVPRLQCSSLAQGAEAEGQNVSIPSMMSQAAIISSIFRKVTATYAFIHFVILKDETLYHHNYEQLLLEFAAMCHDKHENLAVQEEVRHAGIQGLEALLMWCDELLDDIYSPAYMAIIFPCLLFNFNDPEYLSMSTVERQEHSMTPPGIAESCLREYVARTSPSRVHFVLTPMLRYLDEHRLWTDELLPFELFKVVMLSVEAPYAFYLIERLVEHASPHCTDDPHTRARVLEVVIVITEGATDEAVGPAAFYCVGQLLQDLVIAVQRFHGVHENMVSNVEEYYQDTLVRALEAIAMTLPDYYKLEMIVFVIQSVPFPVMDMRDVWLRYLLLDIVEEVSQQYRTLHLTTALPAQLLHPLLQLSLSPNPRVRLSVHSALQNLIDRKGNAGRLREPWTAALARDVQGGPQSPLDAAFMRRFGLELFHALYEGFAVFNNSRRNVRAVFTTAALIIVEAIQESTMIDALRFILNVQEMLEQGAAQNSRWLGELHACSSALSRLLTLVAPCAQLPLAALEGRYIPPTATPAPSPKSPNMRVSSRSAPPSPRLSAAVDSMTLRDAAADALLGAPWAPVVRALLRRQRVLEALRSDGWVGVTARHLAPYSTTEISSPRSPSARPSPRLTPQQSSLMVPVVVAHDASLKPISPTDANGRPDQLECVHRTNEIRPRTQPAWGSWKSVQWERSQVTTVMLVTSTAPDVPNEITTGPSDTTPGITMTSSGASGASTTQSSRLASVRSSSTALLRRSYSMRSHQSGMLTLREGSLVRLVPPRAPRTLESEERWDFLTKVLMLDDQPQPPAGVSRSSLSIFHGRGRSSHRSFTTTTTTSTSSLSESPVPSRPTSASTERTSRRATRILRLRRQSRTKKKKKRPKVADDSGDEEEDQEEFVIATDSTGRSTDSESDTDKDSDEFKPLAAEPPRRSSISRRARSSTDSVLSRSGQRGSITDGSGERRRFSVGLLSTRSSGDVRRLSTSRGGEESFRRSSDIRSRQASERDNVATPKSGGEEVKRSNGDVRFDDHRSSDGSRTRSSHMQRSVGKSSSSVGFEAGAWRRSWAEGVRHRSGRHAETGSTPSGPEAAGAEAGGAGDRHTMHPTTFTDLADQSAQRHSTWSSLPRTRHSLLNTISMRMRAEAAVASTEARFQFTEEQERLRRRFAERPFSELHAPASPLVQQQGSSQNVEQRRAETGKGALRDMLDRVLRNVPPPTTTPIQHPSTLRRSLKHFVFEGSMAIDSDEPYPGHVIHPEEIPPEASPYIARSDANEDQPYVTPFGELDIAPQVTPSSSPSEIKTTESCPSAVTAGTIKPVCEHDAVCRKRKCVPISDEQESSREVIASSPKRKRPTLATDDNEHVRRTLTIQEDVERSVSEQDLAESRRTPKATICDKCNNLELTSTENPSAPDKFEYTTPEDISKQRPSPPKISDKYEYSSDYNRQKFSSEDVKYTPLEEALTQQHTSPEYTKPVLADETPAATCQNQEKIKCVKNKNLESAQTQVPCTSDDIKNSVPNDTSTQLQSYNKYPQVGEKAVPEQASTALPVDSKELVLRTSNHDAPQTPCSPKDCKRRVPEKTVVHSTAEYKRPDNVPTKSQISPEDMIKTVDNDTPTVVAKDTRCIKCATLEQEPKRRSNFPEDIKCTTLEEVQRRPQSTPNETKSDKCIISAEATIRHPCTQEDCKITIPPEDPNIPERTIRTIEASPLEDKQSRTLILTESVSKDDARLKMSPECTKGLANDNICSGSNEPKLPLKFEDNNPEVPPTSSMTDNGLLSPESHSSIEDTEDEIGKETDVDISTVQISTSKERGASERKDITLTKDISEESNRNETACEPATCKNMAALSTDFTSKTSLCPGESDHTPSIAGRNEIKATSEETSTPASDGRKIDKTCNTDEEEDKTKSEELPKISGNDATPSPCSSKKETNFLVNVEAQETSDSSSEKKKEKRLSGKTTACSKKPCCLSHTKRASGGLSVQENKEMRNKYTDTKDTQINDELNENSKISVTSSGTTRTSNKFKNTDE